MPKRLTRAESQAVTRERLLEAAATVFARCGFGGASVDEIVEEAGLSKGAVYANFASKEALFLALLDRCLDEEEQALGEIFARERTLAAQIAAVGRWAPGLVGQPLEWRLLATEFWLHAARHPEVGRALAARYRRQRATAARLIDGAYRRMGRTPPAPVEDLAAAVIALQNGLAQRAAVDPEAIHAGLYGSMLTLLLGGANDRNDTINEGLSHATD